MKRGSPLILVVLLTGCVSAGTDLTSTSASTVETSVTSSTQPAAPILEPCSATGEPIGNQEGWLDSLREAYNARDHSRIVRLIGDGPVDDPTLEPGRRSTYATVREWVEAADRVGDLMYVNGYGPGQPLRLIANRENPDLAAEGIDSLAVTAQFWVRQDCNPRIEVVGGISAPDPCRFSDVFDLPDAPRCDGTFTPRAGHLAFATEDGVILYGGVSSTTGVSPLNDGLIYDATQGVWSVIEAAPVIWADWPALEGVWTGDALHLVGSIDPLSESAAVVVATYRPGRGAWEVSPPRPAPRQHSIGAVGWTGHQVILAGGDNNAPSDQAWAYDPALAEWTELGDSPLEEVEGVESVDIGNEILFVGGYQAGLPVALDKATLTWRQLQAMPGPWVEGHELLWTGRFVLLIGGHVGPGHEPGVRIYDPTDDVWRLSSAMPIPPRERGDAVWTGAELVIWGGYSTYGHTADTDGDYLFGDGTAYDPGNDTWRVLSEAPLPDRCDHSLTWTAEGILVFGGMPECGQPNVLALGDAAFFDPAGDEWKLVERE